MSIMHQKISARLLKSDFILILIYYLQLIDWWLLTIQIIRNRIFVVVWCCNWKYISDRGVEERSVCIYVWSVCIYFDWASGGSVVDEPDPVQPRQHPTWRDQGQSVTGHGIHWPSIDKVVSQAFKDSPSNNLIFRHT